MTIRVSYHGASALLRPLDEGGSVHREHWPRTHHTAVWRSQGHFCFEGITQRCEEMFPWGLSPKEIGAHVFFFFFFHFLDTPLGM